MKRKTIAVIVLLVVFAIGVSYALMREVRREEVELGRSVSGVVEVSPQLFAQGVADVVKTDRLVLFLVDPQTREPVAMRTESPFVPPQTVRIGERDARGGAKLDGEYLVVGLTDKDGEIFKVTPGEVYGRTAEPVRMGDEKLKLVLDEGYRGSLFNEAVPQMAQQMPGDHPPTGGMPSGGMPAGGMGQGGDTTRARPLGEGPPDPEYSIQGTIRVADNLKDNVQPTDKLIILLFDPDVPRPAAFKIIPHTLLPQKFSISLPPQARENAKKGYSLRVITDKDQNPFGSAPGELAGRSDQLVPLGTTGLDFVLNEPYVR